MAENNDEEKKVYDAEVKEENTTEQKKSEGLGNSERAEFKTFTNWMENLPLALKIIFALPFLDIIWGVYRLFKALQENDNLKLVVAILLIVPGTSFTWLLDIIFIILKGNAFWF